MIILLTVHYINQIFFDTRYIETLSFTKKLVISIIFE